MYTIENNKVKENTEVLSMREVSRKRKIREKVISTRRELCKSVADYLDEENKENFEGFAVCAVDRPKDESGLVLSYVCNLDYKFRDEIKGNKARAILRNYFDTLLRKIVSKRPLVKRAGKLLENHKDVREAADVLNEEFGENIINDMVYVEKSFEKAQDEIIDGLRYEHVNVYNNEEVCARLATRVVLSLGGKKEDVDDGDYIASPRDIKMLSRFSSEDVGVINGVKQRVEAVKERLLSYVKKNKDKPRVDRMRLMKLVYSSRLIMLQSQKVRGIEPEYNNLIEKGFVKQIIDLYVDEYEKFLTENLEKEAGLSADIELSNKVRISIHTILRNHTHENFFKKEAGLCNNLSSGFRRLASSYYAENRKLQDVGDAILKYLSDSGMGVKSPTISSGRQREVDSIAKMIGDAYQKNNFENIYRYISKLFTDRAEFVQKNSRYISSIVDRLLKLDREVELKSNFINLRIPNDAPDYFCRAYDSTRQVAENFGNSAPRTINTYILRTNLIFLDSLKYLLEELNQTVDQNSLNYKYAKEAIALISKKMPPPFRRINVVDFDKIMKLVDVAACQTEGFADSILEKGEANVIPFPGAMKMRKKGRKLPRFADIVKEEIREVVSEHKKSMKEVVNSLVKKS